MTHDASIQLRYHTASLRCRSLHSVATASEHIPALSFTHHRPDLSAGCLFLGYTTLSSLFACTIFGPEMGVNIFL